MPTMPAAPEPRVSGSSEAEYAFRGPASSELGVGAEAFAALPAAAHGLFGLLVGTKAAAGTHIHALRLERANSSLAVD